MGEKRRSGEGEMEGEEQMEKGREERKRGNLLQVTEQPPNREERKKEGEKRWGREMEKEAKGGKALKAGSREGVSVELGGGQHKMVGVADKRKTTGKDI